MLIPCFFMHIGSLENVFEDMTSIHASSAAFFHAETGLSYDLFVSSKNKNDLLYVNLASGKMEIIEGNITVVILAFTVNVTAFIIVQKLILNFSCFYALIKQIIWSQFFGLIWRLN